MSGLSDKSIFQLRAIAQPLGIMDYNSKTKEQLLHLIDTKTRSKVPPKPEPIPAPHYDARLMSKPPSKNCTEETVLDLLEVHIKQGLRIDFIDEETWQMSQGKVVDTGSMRMPLTHMLRAADKVVKDCQA